MQSFFPRRTVVVSEHIEAILETPAPDVFINAIPIGTPGFPMGLDLCRYPSGPEPFTTLSVALSRHLSRCLECSAMCDGSGYGTDDSPYWAIIWIDGSAYLADDLETDADPPLAPKIVRRLAELEV